MSVRVRRAAGGALSGALGRRSGQHPRGRAGARARALCERLAQDAILGKVGFARVLKGKQLEITRSGQRRVWETRKAAGSVQSTAAFTCLGGGAGTAWGSRASQTVEIQFSVSVNPGHVCHSVAGRAWPNP